MSVRCGEGSRRLPGAITHVVLYQRTRDAAYVLRPHRPNIVYRQRVYAQKRTAYRVVYAPPVCAIPMEKAVRPHCPYVVGCYRFHARQVACIRLRVDGPVTTVPTLDKGMQATGYIVSH